MANHPQRLIVTQCKEKFELVARHADSQGFAVEESGLFIRTDRRIVYRIERSQIQRKR